MKKTMLIPFLIFLLVGVSGVAQQDSKGQMEMNFGFANLQRQDLSFTPYIYKSWTPLVTQLAYQKYGNLNHEVSLRFGRFGDQFAEPFVFYVHAEDDGKRETFKSKFTLLDINYSLTKALIKNEQWELAAGGRERNRLQITDFAFGEVTHFSYFFIFGLDAALSFDYAIGEKGKFSSQLYLPIFSYQARNPYSTQDGQYFQQSASHKPLPTVWEYIKRGKLTSWKSSQIFDLNTAFHHRINEKWSIGLKYLLSMNFNQDPRPLSSIENNFFISTQLKF